MERQGDEVHMDTTEASAGSRENVVRWVLIVGTFLAIVLLSVAWITGALTTDKYAEEASVGGQIALEDEGDSTDSIVIEDADDIEGAPETANPDTTGPGTVEN